MQQAQKSKVAENKSFPEIICTIFWVPTEISSIRTKSIFFYLEKKVQDFDSAIKSDGQQLLNSYFWDSFLKTKKSGLVRIKENSGNFSSQNHSLQTIQQ